MHLSRVGGALILAGAVLCSTARGQTPASLPEQPGSFDYPSVAAALKALRPLPDVQIQEQNGWTILVQPAQRTIWSFAPATDPAYPAVVKRRVVQDGPMVTVRTQVQCEAPKTACDNLVRQFEALNAQAAASASGAKP